jgi:hypothetical protein
MNATSTKARTDEVRLHTSTKITGGKTYSQTCVRWYERGARKQRCFGQLADAEKFRDSILSKRAKEERVPRGLRIVVQSLRTGERLMIRKDGATFLQFPGQELEPMPLTSALIALAELVTNHDGHTLDDGGGFQGLLYEAVRKLPPDGKESEKGEAK